MSREGIFSVMKLVVTPSLSHRLGNNPAVAGERNPFGVSSRNILSLPLICFPVLKNKLVAAVLLLACISIANAATEVAHFDVMLWGNKIGNLTITKEQRADGSELYVMDSRSKAKILWISRENTIHYEVVYKSGKLISSKFKETENGEVKRWTNVSFDGKLYNIDSYKGKRTFIEAPMNSIVSIYFTDMKNVNRIFYESEGEFNKLEHPDLNTCEFKASDGTRNVYHFVNGQAQNMEFHVSIATVKMVRVK
jgi:hypothetical protein